MRAPVAVAGHADYGFFGPESVTWKVFGYPTAPTVAFQRTAVVRCSIRSFWRQWQTAGPS